MSAATAVAASTSHTTTTAVATTATTTGERVVSHKRGNCIEQAWLYLDGILARQPGLKVLLCDDATRGIMSVAYSQHQLLQHNVVLVDMLSNHKERYPMKHFTCVIICRPSPTSLAAVYQELAEGNFASYSIFFTYLLDQTLVQSLANADLMNLVSHVGEVYLNAVPLTEWICITQLKPPPLGKGPIPVVNPLTYVQWDMSSFDRMAESVISMLLSTNRRPVVRYRAGNQVTQKLASEVGRRMQNVHAIFPDLKARDSVLVILDRMDDPITPLLMPWTYEAMISELIGFQRGNEVVIDDEAEAKPEDRIHILAAHTDSFYGKHRYDDWGQVCLAVSEMVKAYKEMNNFDRDTVSLDEIRNFMNRFPEARKQSAQVTRHCAIASQLVDEIKSRNLTKLSLLEQDLVANSSATEHGRQVLEFVEDLHTDVDDALRLAMLYSLRYEKSSSNVTAQIKQVLAQRQCPRDKIALIDRLLQLGGQERRAHELFQSTTGHIFKSVAKTVGQFGKDVQNVLTQHTPLLKKLVNRIYNGSLLEEKYPVQDVPGCPVPAAEAPSVRGKDIIIVYMGGITYSEAMLLAQINAGTVDNNLESLMNLGKNVSRKLGGGEAPARSDEPYTAKIESHVTLLSTAMINSKIFINSLQM